MNAKRRSARSWRVVLAAAVGAAPAWLVAAALVTLPGCGPRKTEPTLQEMPTATEPEPEVPQGDFRAEALDGLAESLDAKASQLPGRTPDDHRRQIHEFFVDVVQVLPILEGPEPSSAFRQQLRTVEAARDRLNPEAGNVAIGPTIDTGLRATHAALRSIGRDEPYAGQTMAGLLRQLGEKVDELDTVRNVGRPYVAADAARLIAGSVRHMADVVAGRATDTPTTAPADEPLVPPGAIEAPRTLPGVEPTAPTGETETPAEEAPAEETPAEEAPAEEAPAEEMPAEEAPAEETPAEETPAEEMPAEEAPDDDAAPAEGDAPDAAEPATKEPADEDAAKEEPAEEMPAEEAPADDAGAGKEAEPKEDAEAEDDLNK